MKKNSMKKLVAVMLALACCLVCLAGCGDHAGTNSGSPTPDQPEGSTTPNGDSPSASQEPKVLKVAIDAEPLTLDTTLKTMDVVTQVAQHVFECLYVYDANFALQPMLAASDSISDDGKTVEIKLREHVPFHNGKEMKADDVVASIDRWLEYGTKSGIIKPYLDSVEKKDDYTIVLNFNQVYMAWKDAFSFFSGGCWIVPKEVAEAAAGEELTDAQNIGTGPYRFEERQSGRYIKLVKFDDYASRTEEPSGPAGRRTAVIDELYFYFVTDNNTRLNGLRTGEYDYARLLSGSVYESIQSETNLKASISAAGKAGFLFFNLKSPLWEDNPALREALCTALHSEEGLMAGWGHEDLWDAVGNYYPEGNPYYSDKGLDRYNLGNAEKAREMAQAAGYQGEPIRFLLNTSYPTFIDACTVYIQQLRDAGFQVEELRMDGTSLLSYRTDADKWEIFFTHHAFTPQPLVLNCMNPNYAGWWDTPEREALVTKYTGTVDDAARYAVFGDIQELMFEQYPVYRVGEFYEYDAYSTAISGLPERHYLYPTFWNIDVNR